MTVTIWHAGGCITAHYDAETRRLTNYPQRTVARLILNGERVKVRYHHKGHTMLFGDLDGYRIFRDYDGHAYLDPAA